MSFQANSLLTSKTDPLGRHKTLSTRRTGYKPMRSSTSLPNLGTGSPGIGSPGLSRDREKAKERSASTAFCSAFASHVSDGRFMTPQAGVIHAALEDFGRSLEAIYPEENFTMPAEAEVEDWLQCRLPGEQHGQMLSFEEFKDVAASLCPSLSKWSFGQSTTGVTNQDAFGLLHRKGNAASLFDYSATTSEFPRAGTDPGPELVTNPETLCNAVKKEARLTRRMTTSAAATNPGVRLHAAVLQKHRVAATVSTDDMDPQQKVSVARNKVAAARARRQFTGGVANALGATLHLLDEGDVLLINYHPNQTARRRLTSAEQ